ncbi:nitrate reductase molybdenum cofactor assembly chaperone [Georgenia sp. TF02-10]|uniref:nitrate reductase molybdenum cofactor assembly chaperone n=1 Tax=Georgenia sp. TF02-10 TaxID=2917725 RepID=UPI001FA73BAE|nr:nitrate reductase molybdenum cofactor assembly chaperone [Georgenia sp. TF02-10]UNX54437.1 nitrate reductase molybdenum cofactor assembly chaperone [Georgenia sp. TF02-10]
MTALISTNRVLRRRTAQRLAGDEAALVHRVAALLLEYPDDDVLAALPDLRAAVAGLPPNLGEPLARLAGHLAGGDPGQLRADYVATFDHRRRCCLYLTYYAYGDTRKRGVALVELKQAYRAAGLELAAEELPDHLCVLLEFAATGDRVTGIRLLLEHRAGVELLRLALLDVGSPYADALAAVCATLPPLAGEDREAVFRLAAEGPPGEEVGLEPYGPAMTAPAGPPVAAPYGSPLVAPSGPPPAAPPGPPVTAPPTPPAHHGGRP